jgi:RNA polymerase sigma-70 factor (ECF subfamily)
MDVAALSPALPAPTESAGRFGSAHASEDARLVERAGAGDELAFARLYDRYARMVHGILLARVGPADAEDLVQEVFFSAWHRLRALRDPGAFGGWLATIARNRATDHHRRAIASETLSEHLQARDATAARAEALAVLDVIRSLPGAYRETLVLRLVEGLTGPEIAARTGLTPASVRVNLHRGMKLLRQKIDATSHRDRTSA